MDGHSSEMKKNRVTFKKSKENQNIRAVLKDLYSQIVKKDNKTSQKIELALASLSKYPLAITSGEECFILQGFDKTLCSFVDKKIFHKNTALPLTEDASRSHLPELNSNEAIGINTSDQMNSKASTVCKSWKKNINNNMMDYGNRFESKDAVLFALYQQKLEFPDRPNLSLKEMMLKAQMYCKETITDWRLVEVLRQKQIYIKSELKDNLQFYSLTHKGQCLVQAVMKEQNVKSRTCYSLDEHDDDSKTFPYNNYPELTPPPVLDILNTVQAEYPLFIDMPPGSYDIVMLIDKNEPEILSQKCQGLHCEKRTLKVGDVIWLARSKTNSQELVLPYIVERKRIDDFAASIKDGRFHEQKFRLRKCGLKNVIYLIEDHQGNKHCGLPMATLNQAKVNTRVQDGFLVHHTSSTRDTKRFLEMMTLKLTSELNGVHLRGRNMESGGQELMTFENFNLSSSKTKPLTVKSLFIKMLLQLKGLSVEKALAITSSFSSPSALMEACDLCEPKDAEQLLANLKFNILTPRVSPAINKILYKLFVSNNKQLK